MPIEIDDNSIRIIGNDVEGIQFYDDDRTLRQSLSLNSDNELSISGTLETPTMDGDSVWQSATGVPVDIDTDGITIWTSGRNLNYIKYKFNDAGTARTQAMLYAVYNSALKAGEYWISSRRNAGSPWTYSVLHLSAYDTETTDIAALVLTTEYGTPRIDAACDTFNVQGDLTTTGDITATGDVYAGSAPLAPFSLCDAVLGNLISAGSGHVLQCGWLANSLQVFGQAATVNVWTGTGITIANYGAMSGGGAFIALNGSDEYLTLADAGWNEVGTYKLVAWWWVYSSAGGSDRAIIGKMKSTDEQSWLMHQDASTGWTFSVNGTGAEADRKVIASSHALAATTWTFVGVFYEPSTGIRIYVGEVGDTTLTMDENTTSIPAALFNGTADLRLGATSTPAMYWNGYLGAGAIRIGGYSYMDDYVGTYLQRVFDMTKYLYSS